MSLRTTCEFSLEASSDENYNFELTSVLKALKAAIPDIADWSTDQETDGNQLLIKTNSLCGIGYDLSGSVIADLQQALAKLTTMDPKVIFELDLYQHEPTEFGEAGRVIKRVRNGILNDVVPDLQLVRVVWGEDIGLVSMTMMNVLAYAFNVRGEFCTARDLPAVVITDADMEKAGYEDGGNWDDVPDYLVARPELWKGQKGGEDEAEYPYYRLTYYDNSDRNRLIGDDGFTFNAEGLQAAKKEVEAILADPEDVGLIKLEVAEADGYEILATTEVGGTNNITTYKPVQDTTDEVEHCDECGAAYPADADSLFGRFHKTSCSLHPDNIAKEEE